MALPVLTVKIAPGGSNNVTSGTNVYDSNFNNSGTISVKNASLEITGTIAANTSVRGSLVIGPSGTLQLDAGVANQDIDFLDNTGTLVIESLSSISNTTTISGLAAGDSIVIPHLPANFTENYNAVTGVLTLSQGLTVLGSVRFGGAIKPSASTIKNSVVICFVSGTLIATDAGEIPVERLQIGDRVVTLNGKTEPVVWIGTGQVLATRGRRNEATPVIVRKGAIANNVPHHDLHVTKGHAFYLDEVLIPVEFLVNHRSIEWDDRAQEVTIYHVELASHQILLANGAPAESYRDDGNRWLFRNANEGWAFPPKPPYAPVLTGGSVVDAVWRRLLDRAGPRPGLPLTDDPDLHLLVDDKRLEPAALAKDYYLFKLDNVPGTTRLVSRAAAPQELGLSRDQRSLGVGVHQLIVRQGNKFCALQADHPLLWHGFHSFEAENGCRWTTGDALLPGSLFSGFSGPLELVVRTCGTTFYVEDARISRVA
jgi:Hint domain-containing protein